jgi:hypothetical protein
LSLPREEIADALAQAAEVLHYQLLRDLALRCLYESTQRPVGLRSRWIAHPHVEPTDGFTVKGNTLGILSHETLPQFERLLATRIENNKSDNLPLDARPIGRYAAAILPRVRAAYPGGVKRIAAAPSVCMMNVLPAGLESRRRS